MKSMRSLFTKIIIIGKHATDPLFRNSFFISLSRFSDMGFGFIFWIVAARFYTIGELGEATAIISSLGLVIILSRFGLDISQVRFVKEYDKNTIFNTCLWIPAAGAVIIGAAYLTFLQYSTVASLFIHGFFFIFILIAFLSSITLTIGNAFVSIRKAEYRFVQNLILGIRIPILIVLVSFGSIGIFISYGIAYLLTTAFALLLAKKFFNVKLSLDKQFMQATSKFTYLSYFSNLFYNGPILIMPLLILYLSNAENAALYYIAFAFGGLVMIIPDAIGMSFFVEGSQGGEIKKGILRSFLVTSLILVPAILIIWIFGGDILGWLGKDYYRALSLLKIFIISTFFISIYNLFNNLEIVRFKPQVVFIMNGLRALLIVFLSYIFFFVNGIEGVAYAWMATHLILCILVFWLLRSHIGTELKNLQLLYRTS